MLGILPFIFVCIRSVNFLVFFFLPSFSKTGKGVFLFRRVPAPPNGGGGFFFFLGGGGCGGGGGGCGDQF